MGTHLNKKDEKNSILKKVATWVIVIAVALFLVGMTVFNYITDNGVLARRQTAMESENYSVSVAEMSYYFYTAYQNVVYSFAYQGISTSTLGLDTSVSLKSQKCTFGDGTWFDYFMDQAETSVKSILTLCEEAKAAGITLDDEDTKTIDETFDSMKEAAKEQNMSLKDYIRNSYGSIVREDDVRDAMELSLLASKYSEKVAEDVDVSDEALEKEYTDNKNDYDKVSYLTYTFNYKDYMPAEEDEDETTGTDSTSAPESTVAETEETEAETEAETEGTAAETDEPSETTATTPSDKKEEEDAAKKDAIADIKKYGDELAEKKDIESFTKYVEANLKDVLAKKEEDIKKATDALEKKNASYSSSSEQMKWAFEAKEGDTKVFADEKGETVTVLLLTSDRGRVEEVAYRDVRHILFKSDNHKDDTKAREVYDKWVADGAKVDDFAALAAEYSEDPGSVDNGGLYESVAEGEMVDEFNDWLFDPERKEGDHGIVKAESTGWHIMYYAGGEIGWKADAEATLKNEAVEAASEAAEENHAVTVNRSRLNSINA